MTPKTKKLDKDDETTSSGSSGEESGVTASEASSESDSSTPSTATSTTTASSSSNEESESDDGKRKKSIPKKSDLNKNVIKSGGKRKRRVRPITICLNNCRYEIVRRAARKYNLKEVNEDECWNIYWTDFSVSLERAMDMRRFQIVNHFPGMNEICRKDLLARNLNRMRKLFPNEYDIYPKTWSLPADLGELQTYAHIRRNKTFICKPEMGCQGRGIFLIRNIKDLNPFGKIICQLYIARPFLIDDLKFDLRIYVLMTSCDPLRVYLYKEGLARFATAKYKTPTNMNTENSYMHLTNYAVNKFSRDYIVDDEAGTKRKLTAVYRWLEARNYDVGALVESIDGVILKTIISAHPVLRHNYRTCFPNHDTSSACFEILGFDILLDHKLKPFVLEVNHSPSFHTDARLDLEIKEGLVQDAINMLNLKRLDRHKVQSADRRRVQERLLSTHGGLVKPKKEGDKEKTADKSAAALEAQFAYEAENTGGFRLIYPAQNSEKYDVYFEQNMSSLFAETAASQARALLTRNQIQDYNQKKQQEELKRNVGGKEPLQKEKEKMQPEAGAPAADRTLLLRKCRPFLFNSFQPLSIDANEELERMKGIMHRGMLVRSLGIESQVFQLLCQVGTIKPEEERIFRRMHGFTNNLTSHGPKTPFSSQLYQRKPQTAGGDHCGEHGRGGDAYEFGRKVNIQDGQDQTSCQVGTMQEGALTPPPLTKSSFQVTHPHLSHGNVNAGFAATLGTYQHNQDKFPSQPEAYTSYNIMSQMRKNLTTANASKNNVDQDEADPTTGLLSHAATQLNSMAPFRGESSTVKAADVWSRYDAKARSGFYNDTSQQGRSYVPPKTGISSSPSYNYTGTNNQKTPGRDQYRNTSAPFNSMDGETKPWKLGYPVIGSYHNEPPPTTAVNVNWPPSPSTVTGQYADEGFKPKINKLVQLGDGAGQPQPRGTVRGSSFGQKMTQPPVSVTQMFDPKPRTDSMRTTRYYGAEVKTGRGSSGAKGKLPRQSDLQPQSSLILTGTRIGTAPPARKY